jgi:hypothetical protein
MSDPVREAFLARVRQAVQQFMDKGEKLSNYSELQKRVRLAQAVVTLN